MVATTYKAINLPVQGVTATWGDALNNGPFTDLDIIVGGITTKTLSNANVTLTAAESKSAILRLSGAISANIQITTVTNGFCMVQNATTGAYLVTFTNGAGAVALIPQGMSTMVHIDSVNGVFLAGARTSTVGQISAFSGTTVPGGWLKANGQLVSRASYAALWTYAQASGNIQTDANWTANTMYGAFSSGDGSTTFRVPDLRGTFVRPWADDGSTDAGRTCGQSQTAQNLSHTHTATSTVTDPGHHHPYTGVSAQGQGPSWGGSCYYSTASFNSGNSTTGITVGTTNTTNGGADMRPYNIALMHCISYL